MLRKKIVHLGNNDEEEMEASTQRN